MLVDSHCHLNLLDLTEFNNNIDNVFTKACENDVKRFLCVSVDLFDYPILCDLAAKYPNVNISVGLHPNSIVNEEPDLNSLTTLADNPACIAIGETGLDYYRTNDEEAKVKQRQRFRTHIHTARKMNKPLIIHTRCAADDTLAIMHEEKVQDIGGVMHCFTESWDVATKALAMNFYISISGIVTFKNATQLHEVAKKVPLERLLIETDSPFLAPVPYRGKQNHPALVKYVANALSELRQISYEEIAERTTANFSRCFNCALF